MRVNLVLFILLFIFLNDVYAFSSHIKRFSGKNYLQGELVVVPEYETWIFEPGATILFDEGAKLLVYGGIKVLGEVKRITFGSSKNSWQGIDFYGNRQIPQYRFSKFNIASSLHANKIINGLFIQNVSNSNGHAINIRNDHVVLDKISVAADQKTSLLNIHNSEVVIGSSTLNCTGSKGQIVADRSLLYMNKVVVRGTSDACNNIISSKDSIVGLSKVEFSSVRNTFFAIDSKVYMNNSKIHSGIDAISLRNTFFEISESEFLTTIANSFKVLRDSRGIVRNSKIITTPQNKNSGRKGCPVFATSGAIFELVNNEINSNCINTAYDFFQNPGLVLNKKIKWELSKFIRNQKILDVDQFNDVEGLDLLINELLIDPKIVKRLKPEEIQIINSLTDKIMGENRLIRICMVIDKIDIDDSISREVSSFFPSEISLTEKEYDTVDQCVLKGGPAVFDHYKIEKYVTKGIESLNNEYARAVNNKSIK